MADEKRQEGSTAPKTAVSARKDAEASLVDQNALWSRIESVTSYLIPRKRENHFSESILHSVELRRHP